MCGICGFNWQDGDLAREMAAAISHRGPDDEGFHVEEGVSLGFRRLSIIDLSRNAAQPMSNEDGRLWLVFNGEIYNFRELRRELKSRGHHFRSQADSEVILHAYEDEGPKCLERLRGMFAFAIWDSRRKELFLARDRIGIKPLYYYWRDGKFAFASEIKAILKDPAIKPSLNYQALYHFLGFEFVPGPETLFEDIYKLQPGHTLKLAEGKEPEVREYWDLTFRDVHRPVEEYMADLVEELGETVGSHLVSDVPLGAFLSGGIDSSALVAFMQKHLGRGVSTFALGYENQTYSELEYAQRVATHFGTDHREIILDPIDHETVEKALWHFDEPMTDLSAVPFYAVAKKAREHVTVCLSGEGGDEVFVGYDRFKASKAERWYHLMPRWLRREIITPFVERLPDNEQKKGASNILQRFIAGADLPEEGGHMRWQYFLDPAREEALLQESARNRMDRRPFGPVAGAAARCNSANRLDREIYVDTRFTMPDSVLMKVDKMSMAHSLEVRVPFLDHRFVELAASIPSRYKLQGFTTKSVFKRAMKDRLPPGIAYRKKQGYSFPIKNWLRGDLRGYMRDRLHSSSIIRENLVAGEVDRLMEEHIAMTHNHSHILWALICLSIWHDLYFGS
jgi:asparagine synthase (glutamine-hydrolysing)